MKCTHCGHNVKAGKFCDHCGALAESASEPSAAAYDSSANKEYDFTGSASQTPKNAPRVWIYVLAVVLLLSAFIGMQFFLNSDSNVLFSVKSDNPTITSQEAQTVYKSELGKDTVLVARRGEKLYYVYGDEIVRLSESAGDIDIYISTEQIADGTFFVVENLKTSENAYAPLDLSSENYFVGDLVMITPDKKRTFIAENVYELIFSSYDDVLYYQVVETDRQKLCVVIDGKSHDLTGWVDGNIHFEFGAPDGSLVYFRHLTEDSTELCIGQNGSYDVTYTTENDAYWVTGDDQDPVIIVEYIDNIQHYLVVENGEIIATLPNGLACDANFANSNLIVESTAYEMILYEDYTSPVLLACGLTADDSFVLLYTSGYETDWLLYTVDQVLYILDTSDRAAEPILLGPVTEWYYSYDPETQSVYITGNPDIVYTYVLGDDQAKQVPLTESAVSAYNINGAAESFYYFTGDANTYDYTIDYTDLYYYNGSEHVLLMSDASWFVGVVVPAFNNEKVLWLANGELYMANPDGTNQQTLMESAWWVLNSGGNIYGISYDGEVYLLSSDGSHTLLLDGSDDFFTLDPKW